MRDVPCRVAWGRPALRSAGDSANAGSEAGPGRANHPRRHRRSTPSPRASIVAGGSADSHLPGRSTHDRNTPRHDRHRGPAGWRVRVRGGRFHCADCTKLPTECYSPSRSDADARADAGVDCRAHGAPRAGDPRAGGDHRHPATECRADGGANPDPYPVANARRDARTHAGADGHVRTHSHSHAHANPHGKAATDASAIGQPVSISNPIPITRRLGGIHHIAVTAWRAMRVVPFRAFRKAVNTRNAIAGIHAQEGGPTPGTDPRVGSD
jgi:hypothetical protein